MEDDPRTEVLFGGADENVGVDGLAGEVGGLVEFYLDLGGGLVAHFVCNKVRYKWDEYYYIAY